MGRQDALDADLGGGLLPGEKISYSRSPGPMPMNDVDVEVRLEPGKPDHPFGNLRSYGLAHVQDETN